MAIKILKGHLTATDRRAVAYMLGSGLTACQTKRITFTLTTDDTGVHVLTTKRAERDDWGREHVRTDRTTFTA